MVRINRKTALARRDRPFPLWLVFPLIFTGVYLTHLSLLRLPYYWDEAGYYIPAAYDFFRTGKLIPYSTLSNAHPPLPAIYLAAWWKLSGFVPATTRVAMCLLASAALLAVYRLAQLATGKTAIAAVTVLLTALYPVWFAQSTLAHADLLASVGTLWGLVFVVKQQAPMPKEDRTLWTAALFFAFAALAKETAVATPLALAAYELVLLIRTAPVGGKIRLFSNTVPPLLLSLLPLCGWYAYHWHETGFVLGNPEYLRYNAIATLSLLRIVLAFAHRLMHITAHMNMFVPVLCGFAALFLDPLLERDGTRRPRLRNEVVQVFLVVLAANLVFFSVLGGALLTRYLLPLYPLVLILCVAAFYRHVRYWYALATLSAMAFIIGLFINPPYHFAPEDNLSYRDAIVLHQGAIRQIIARYPGSTVLTAWPGTDELTKPELGYVRRPVSVVEIDNFSPEEIQRAIDLSNGLAAPFAVSFPFSTKYDPPRLPFSLGSRNEALDRRFFSFHHDLSPQEIADLLHGGVVWQAERKGQWAAVIHFDRSHLASSAQR